MTVSRPARPAGLRPSLTRHHTQSPADGRAHPAAAARVVRANPLGSVTIPNQSALLVRAVPSAGGLIKKTNGVPARRARLY